LNSTENNSVREAWLPVEFEFNGNDLGQGCELFLPPSLTFQDQVDYPRADFEFYLTYF